MRDKESDGTLENRQGVLVRIGRSHEAVDISVVSLLTKINLMIYFFKIFVTFKKTSLYLCTGPPASPGGALPPEARGGVNPPLPPPAGMYAGSVKVRR